MPPPAGVREAVHTDTFIRCATRRASTPKYVYGMSDGMPSVQERDEPVVDLIETAADLDEAKNFFETRVTEYQSGGSLDW